MVRTRGTFVEGYNGTPEERFWRKVKKGKPDECWEWVIKNKRYGSFFISGKLLSAHRYSYELHKGKIPEGLCVCHSCDNTFCVNPKHLWLGTLSENSKDRENKGRGANNHGEKCGTSKLTQKQVDEIRELYKTGKYTRKELTEKYGIKGSQIHRIINNQSWKQSAPAVFLN